MGKVLRIVATIAIAVVAVALAAPTGGLSVAGALGLSGLTATVVGAVAAAAFAITATLALNAILPPPSARTGASSAIQNYRQSIAASTLIYGKRRAGGLIVFFHPKKSGKNYYRYFVIAVAGHRSKGMVQWWLNDETVGVDSDGKVTSGTYAGAAWLWFQRGTDDQAANATFVAECEGQWTTAHRGRGVTAIYAKFQMTNDVVQAGMPAITVTIEGKDDLLDMRDGSVGYSRNAQLVWRDWLALPKPEGGFGAYPEELDDDWDSAYANLCDESCTTPDGTEPRYAFDSVITTGAAPSDVRTTFIASCAGAYTYAGGKYLLRPGSWEPVSATLEEDDLAGPIVLPALLGGDEIVTEVTGTFVDPSQGYQAQSVMTRTVTSDIDAQADADLAHVTSQWQGQRVLEIMLRRAQCEKKLTWPMNITGIGVTALDTVRPNTMRYGLSNYAFQIANWSMTSDFNIVLNLREENSDIYDDPDYLIPGTAGTIFKADPVPDATEIAATRLAIQNSSSFDVVVTADDLGASTSITVNDHHRVYPDRTVAVTGATIAGFLHGAAYYVYYDDEARLGGSVTYGASGSRAEAFLSDDNPDRHYVGAVRTPGTGGAPTDGSGSSPPGGGYPEP